MLNQIILVGRLAEELELKELENGEKIAKVILAIPRLYKNEDGIYETDFIPLTLLGNIASNASEYCQKGDLVGVKGRIENNNTGLEIIADKVTFLSSRSPEEEKVD